MPAKKHRSPQKTEPPSIEGSRLVRPARAKTTVAITGAASFLGRNLVGLLEDDDRIGRIVAIDLSAPATAGNKTRAYEVDLTTPAAEERTSEILAAERAECVVHQAMLDRGVADRQSVWFG
jgi:UDP-glucose 4-epimerase